MNSARALWRREDYTAPKPQIITKVNTKGNVGENYSLNIVSDSYSSRNDLVRNLTTQNEIRLLCDWSSYQKYHTLL